MAANSFSVRFVAGSKFITDIGLIGSSPRAVSGGFVIVQPGSKLSINAVEGFPLEDFSADVSSIHIFVLCRAQETCSTGDTISNH